MLYNSGDHIVIWTARGAESGIDYRTLTEKQLREWGVQYHELRMDKPAFDMLIEDKSVQPYVFRSNTIDMAKTLEYTWRGEWYGKD